MFKISFEPSNTVIIYATFILFICENKFSFSWIFTVIANSIFAFKVVLNFKVFKDVKRKEENLVFVCIS